MANLSNINNKFLFTDGDFLKIGNSAPINNISGTESGISITNGNCASITLDNSAAQGKTFSIYSAVDGSLNFYDVDANSGRLVIDTSGNATFAGDITGVGASFIGAATSGVPLVTIENNSGSTATSYGLLVIGGGNSSNGRTFEVRDASGNTDLIVKGNGNVGIGVTSPNAKLDILGQTLNLGGDNGSWNARTNSTVKTGFITSPHYTNAEEDIMGMIMIGLSNANEIDIGGGTSTYNAATDIKFFTASNSTTVTGTERMRIENTGVMKFANTATSTGDVGTIAHYTNNYMYIRGGTGGLAIGDDGFDTNIYLNNSNSIQLQTGGSERMRWLADGQFWIKLLSTTSGREASMANDNDKLQIFGSRHGGTGKYVSIWSDGANENTRFYPTKTVFYKDVGINKIDPAYKLHVRGGSATEETVLKIDKTATADSGGHMAILGLGTESGAWAKGGIGFERTGAYDTGKMHFLMYPTGNNTNTVGLSNSVMTINNDGNVGIGATSPGQKLQVNGSIKIANSNSRLVFGTSGGTDRRALEGNTSGSLLQIGEGYTDIALQGNVGIGVTSPWTKLAVTGTTASNSPSIVRSTTSTTTWTTIITFSTGQAYSVLLATGENNFSQMWRVSGSSPQGTCYYTMLGDSGHAHSKDVEFRISSNALQYKNINYTTGRYLFVFDVVQSTGTFTY